MKPDRAGLACGPSFFAGACGANLLRTRRTGGAQVLLPDPVIHLYWAYALVRAEKMFKVTRFPPGICGAQAEREYATMDPKKITCPFCRERAKARSGSEQER
jgi:hypothetical protein